MKHLFDEDTDRKEALLDSKAMIEAMNELGVRIKVSKVKKIIEQNSTIMA